MDELGWIGSLIMASPRECAHSLIAHIRFLWPLVRIHWLCVPGCLYSRVLADVSMNPISARIARPCQSSSSASSYPVHMTTDDEQNTLFNRAFVSECDTLWMLLLILTLWSGPHHPTPTLSFNFSGPRFRWTHVWARPFQWRGWQRYYTLFNVVDENPHGEEELESPLNSPLWKLDRSSPFRLQLIQWLLCFVTNDTFSVKNCNFNLETASRCLNIGGTGPKAKPTTKNMSLFVEPDKYLRPTTIMLWRLLQSNLIKMTIFRPNCRIPPMHIPYSSSHALHTLWILLFLLCTIHSTFQLNISKYIIWWSTYRAGTWINFSDCDSTAHWPAISFLFLRMAWLADQLAGPRSGNEIAIIIISTPIECN